MIGAMNEDWLAPYERKLRWLEIPDLPAFLTTISGVVGVLSWVKPEFPYKLALWPDAALGGEPWRLMTFFFLPPGGGPLGLILWLLLFYSILSMLERAWGDLRLSLYIIAGIIAVDLAAMATGLPLGAGWLQAALFLAFASHNAEQTLLLYFVLPVKMKWLAWAVGGAAAWTLLTGGWIGRVSVAAGLFNYLLWFGPGLWQELRWRLRRRL